MCAIDARSLVSKRFMLTEVATESRKDCNKDIVIRYTTITTFDYENGG